MNKRELKRVHLRGLDRGIARERMRKLKVQHPCKKIGGTSYFAENWRKYI